MPTYDNPINFGSGLKIGQGVPVDDRFVFNNLADATAYVTTGTGFFAYNGLWVYLVDPGDYYYIKITNPNLPWDSISNPYTVVRYSDQIGGLPTLGQANQQLVVNPAGTAPEYDYYTSRGLFRFQGAATANPSITTEGIFLRATGPNIFQNVHISTNYPINAISRLPMYFLFKIDGNDFIVGQYGIFEAPGHGLTQRVPLYLRTTFVSTNSTYYTNVLTTTQSTTNGQYNMRLGTALNSNNIFVDLTHEWKLVESTSGGSGNATIQRTTIQKVGAGGLPEDPDGFFTIPHGFGDQQGMVQVVALNTTPPPYTGGSGDVLVTVDTVAYENGAVRLKLDYGLVDPSLIFQVILIF